MMDARIKVTSHVSEWTDCNETVHPEQTLEWEPQLVPYMGLSSYCFVVKRGIFGKYRVEEHKVMQLCFDGEWSWRLSDGNLYGRNRYGITVFSYNDLPAAIEACEKKNRMMKVKVKYM